MVQILDAATNVVLDQQSYASFSEGIYARWSVLGDVIIAVTETGSSHAVVSGLFFDPASPASPASSATYKGADTSTQGSWSGTYGADGFMIANGAAQMPAYGSATTSGGFTYTWADPTSDPRALQTSPWASTFIASTYAGSSFSYQIKLSDGKPHQIALYLLDFDGVGRSEMVQILDAATNVVLDQQSYASFSEGIYARWSVLGDVIIAVTETGSSHAVVSGLFFDPASPASPASSATYKGTSRQKAMRSTT
jgi:hypothetical protein